MNNINIKEMNENRKIRVAITHGDTNGIGYELIFKTFAEPEMLELCTPIIYGSPKTAAYHRKALDIQTNFSIVNSAEEIEDGRINLIPCFDEEVKVDMGQPTPESGKAALKALDCAMTDYRKDLYDVLVTAPLSCGNIEAEGFKFPGHAEYIETSLGDGKKSMIICVHDDLRIATVSNQCAFKDIASDITKDNIQRKATLFFEALRRDFNISNPRIAVLSLNAINKEGELGTEEKEIIEPAINELASQGIQAFGPYTATTFFGSGAYDEFDGILGMYHDQGIAPFKALTDERNVKFAAGIPIVTTSPDMTPCFSIAGQGVVDETAFRHAIFLAIDIFRNRQRYDEPLSHPLPKLYHERRDESEKVRFSIPKKHENGTSRKPQGKPTTNTDTQEES
uniref:4-hydroxythreonine-4-phosphate dehydrogenase PdxA n=1 Tax=Prevotella sp. GTC17254 TaxID=3236794 RepID=A0AB33IV40_9BACT